MGYCEGIPKNITNENLRNFSATAASSGGIALFHMIGITPDAQTREMAFNGKEPKEIVELHVEDLIEAEKQITNYDVKDRVDIVLLGCPHYSYNDCLEIYELFGDRRVDTGIQMWVIVGRSTVDRLKDSGLYEKIIGKGVQIYSDGCILEYRSQKLNTKSIMSDSGKFSTYCFGMRGIQPVLGHKRECVETAINNKLIKEERPWKK